MALTILTVISTILSIVTGFFGVKTILKTESKWWKLSAVIMACIVLIVTIWGQEIYYNSRLEALQDEYLISDSRIIVEMQNHYTNNYSGALAKLAIVVGFYKRHRDLYDEEYIKFDSLYRDFEAYHKAQIAKKGYVLTSEIEEVEQVASVGLFNIEKIISRKAN